MPYVKMLAMLTLMVTSTVMCIYGPRLTGRATTLLAEGILSKYRGGAGIDFEATWKDVTQGCQALLEALLREEER